MTNEQWNSGQPEGGWQPQGEPQWNQQQPQPGWGAQPPQPAAPWPPQQEQGWSQQPGVQQWQGQAPAGQGQQPGGQVPGGQVPDQGWGQQQWQPVPPPRKPSSGLGNVFDFSFSKLALPSAAGGIFLVVVIVVAIGWVFNLAAMLSYGVDFFGSSGSLIGSLATALLTILFARILLEIGVFVSRIAEQTKPKDVVDDGATEAPKQA